ncbi:mRNA interferase RelE/StbE [Bathymodiolus platifrons methanotrophic gill symbiont]|uniref:type II toxin-antitoxin system RelE family toxin n=1 Tax=Bathymodiolus platifrons methanotrophic gill symbiont TaxID=113268 RepID=UPI000B40EF06|nr:type II toxin-antitoxin system RelE/ParE family toxin [Bathymodiolus platifrons methanotrophic gill symbiont]TXL04253.1 type II toxin-antitoxin system mRNA interferase toxin, RelE/StbE family [Methylococcaceae bacterium CS1]GAW86709.1 mRNA interferase RelE/StbE [Bathymodiolus platifrons methanotrophic gill symbiont]GAW86895.1 mRNA interferase RelE/StbE [Bathymodiolus platifrons methanotrophic gill symbiont]GFO74240.1 mRNA interferase RelE/StbE [Bathymodiolus platifrons methanotrophic gill sy
MYKIEFGQRAKKQFYKLSREVQERLTKAIDEKLSVNPKEYLIPLAGNKAGLYKFRVGDYRLLCSRDDEELHVLVVKVKHRREVYRG